MRVLLSWLREFVDVADSATQIADVMSLRGFAVEGIEYLSGESSSDAPQADAVIDFEVTGNRPDCMSVIGMAREVATAYGVPLRGAASVPAGPPAAEPALQQTRGRPGSTKGGPAGSSPEDGPGLEITLENPDLCPCYVGAVADVTPGPSPAWMQQRLKAGGVRPINNIVDITNYVLLELGQPMHAFDAARIEAGHIRVRTAREGERLTTLDGQQRALSPDMLVIADASRPVAIAGVMGGADSEVDMSTRTIVLESAYFHPLSVRRTSRTLGLKTEASMRFERGTDRALPLEAMRRACALLETIGAGRARSLHVGGGIDAEPRLVELRRERVSSLLGVAIPDAGVRRILSRLGFAVEDSRNVAGWRVAVPPRRVDVSREVDLVEELARHNGFDRIPSTFPALHAAPPPPDPRVGRARHLRQILTGMGFSEAVTFGFTSERAAVPFAPDANRLVRIRNPLSEALNVMRPSLLPGLVEAASLNLRRGRTDVRLFEIGNRFQQDVGERPAVAFVWTGLARGVHWSERPRLVDLFDAKEVARALALGHGIDVEARRIASAFAFLTPGKAAELLPRPKGARANTLLDALTPPPGALGFVGELSPEVADAFDVPSGTPVYVAELDTVQLSALAETSTTVVPIPRFPSVIRDISILIDEQTEAIAIRGTITEAAGDTLEDVREFDRYQGKGVPEGQVSLSLRLTFRSSDRTLTDEEVQRAMHDVLEALKEKHAATQR